MVAVGATLSTLNAACRPATRAVAVEVPVAVPVLPMLVWIFSPIEELMPVVFTSARSVQPPGDVYVEAEALDQKAMAMSSVAVVVTAAAVIDVVLFVGVIALETSKTELAFTP